MTTTDTPRTNSFDRLYAFDGLSSLIISKALRILSKNKYTSDGSAESWIALGAERLEKLWAELAASQDEVERLKNLIESYAEDNEQL